MSLIVTEFSVFLIQVSEVAWGGGRSLSLGAIRATQFQAALNRPYDVVQPLWRPTEQGFEY